MSEHGSDSSSDQSSWGLWHGLNLPLSGPQALRPFGNDAALQQLVGRPTETEVVQTALTSRFFSQRRCTVPKCTILNCSLGTHLDYDAGTTKQTQPAGNVSRRAEAALRQIETYNNRGSPFGEGVDGFPSLPMQESLDPAIRSLFHFFFTQTFDKLAVLFRGPSVTNMNDFKQRMLAAALKSEAYCRSLVLQACTEQDIARDSQEESNGALMLSSGTLRAFQEQLDVIRQKPHPLQIELALLVVCVLLMYDAAHGRQDSQRLHWQGMRDLVTMRGGIHCVTMALAYVLHADRAAAVEFEDFPTYTNPLSHTLPTPQLSPNPSGHGSKILAMKNAPVAINTAVLDHLIAVSGLVEMWEEQGSQATRINRRGSKPSLEYLHYVRDRVDEQFAVLNAHWARINSPERCLLWASRIVEYSCTWSNYVQTETQNLWRRLASTLQQQQTTGAQRFSVETLLWMLFSLTTVRPGSGIHNWSIEYLCNILATKYGPTPWSQLWRVGEEDNLLQFVWSSTHHANQFRDVCNRVEKRSHEMAGVQHRSLVERRRNPSI